MSRFSKFSALLFTLLLSFVSISGDRYEVMLSTVLEKTTEVDGAGTQLSEKSLTDAFALHQQSETVVSPANQLPAPGSKIQPKHYLSASSSIEFSVQRSVIGYLSRARAINPSRSIAVIIFPFHHFL